VQLFKTTLKKIEKDIEYYIQQCFAYSLVYYEFIPFTNYDDDKVKALMIKRVHIVKIMI
jgi:hypothetical protein